MMTLCIESIPLSNRYGQGQIFIQVRSQILFYKSRKNVIKIERQSENQSLYTDRTMHHVTGF